MHNNPTLFPSALKNCFLFKWRGSQIQFIQSLHIQYSIEYMEVQGHLTTVSFAIGNKSQETLLLALWLLSQ